LNRYDSAILSHLNSTERLNSNITSPLFLANVGFVSPIINNNADLNTYQYSKMQDFFRLVSKDNLHNGFFIESFQDWEAAVPGHITQSVDDTIHTYPFGLIQWNGKRRQLYDKISYLLDGTTDEIVTFSEGSKQSNVFSLTIFISSIIFFLIYGRSYRLKENIKRSIAHPYGFFVDLRDRRIISIFNSTLIGLYTLLLLANLIAAIVYYFHDNLFFEEYISTLLVPLGVKLLYLKISDSPLLLVLCTWLCFTLMQLLLVFCLRIISIFAREKIRNRQLLAVCNWAGSPILLLLPISLLSYQLLSYENFRIVIFIIIFLYFLWFNYRLGNGIRVLYILSSLKVYIIMILTYSLVLSIFGAFFKAKYDVFNYFELLKQAQNLFY
jgi:hypothetical protein